jgi:hypothetical protein
VSRSNPSEHLTNPATRWFEWNGSKGNLRYYDKTKKQKIDVGLPFTFLLLDQVATVRGFNKASKSGIYANEVKDTTKDPLVVKSFKGGTIAEGLYREIKDRVKSAGASYTANCYIAFKDEAGTLQIAVIGFRKASLGGWMDFTRDHRSGLYTGAIKIDGYKEGVNGNVVFRVPTFKVVQTSDETNALAESLDEKLQEYLRAYLGRNKRDAADSARHVSDEEIGNDYNDDSEPDDSDYDDGAAPSRDYAPVTDDDIPF